MPVAPWTWEVRADLLSTERETGRIPFSFQRPVELIGFHAVVTSLLPLAGGGLVEPTLADIDVQLDLNDRERFTNQLETGIGAVQAAAGSSFVALGSLTMNTAAGGNRLVRIRATNASPDFGIRFGWRQFTQGTPLFESCRVSLAAYCRLLTTNEMGR
jgi:hypothetical protein